MSDAPISFTEADDAGCEPVPANLVELHEVLEWEAAVAELQRTIDDEDGLDVTDTQTGQGVE